MKTGCELMCCSDYKDGKCHHPAQVCKFRSVGEDEPCELADLRATVARLTSERDDAVKRSTAWHDQSLAAYKELDAAQGVLRRLAFSGSVLPTEKSVWPDEAEFVLRVVDEENGRFPSAGQIRAALAGHVPGVDLAELLRMDQPYPLHDLVTIAADAISHLLNGHNCDCTGWEKLQIAMVELRKVADLLDRRRGGKEASRG